MSFDGWITFLSLESFWWRYGFFFSVSLVEMWFPPIPGDALYFVGLVSISVGGISAFGAIGAAWLGGLVGFATLYWLGRARGRRLFMRRETGMWSQESLAKVEGWFARWGGWVIVFGRFLTGIRAIVPIAAGATLYPRTRALVLGAISILIWNGLLAAGALVLGNNWERVSKLLRTYNMIFWLLLATAVMVWFIRNRWRARVRR